MNQDQGTRRVLAPDVVTKPGQPWETLLPRVGTYFHPGGVFRGLGVAPFCVVLLVACPACLVFSGGALFARARFYFCAD